MRALCSLRKLYKGFEVISKQNSLRKTFTYKVFLFNIRRPISATIAGRTCVNMNWKGERRISACVLKVGIEPYSQIEFVETLGHAAPGTPK